MGSIYKINPQLDIPIYQQLVDSIRAAVKTGELAANQQLPTVQELSASLGIARGTIKRAYDELDQVAGLCEEAVAIGRELEKAIEEVESRDELPVTNAQRLETISLKLSWA